MEAAEVSTLVDEKVKEALKANNAELLQSIGSMVSKISSPVNSFQNSASAPDTLKFKRKSNEEQFKQNARVLSKLDEAERSLNAQNIDSAKQAVIEAKELLKRRQKLVQLADASELGWKVVAEYETNPIASDSEDERRIFKAEARASRKDKASKTKKKPYRQSPYSRRGPRPETQTSSYLAANTQQRPGLCFQCGKSGHWKKECPQRDRSMNKISLDLVTTFQSEISEMGKVGKVSHEIDCDEMDTKTTDGTIVEIEGKKKSDEYEAKRISPVGRLKVEAEKWKKTTNSGYILDVIQNGYKLPFKELPKGMVLKNNKSSRDDPDFVKTEIKNLLDKEIISEVSDRPVVVNPLTVAYNKNGKARLVLDCRHINPCLHLFKIKFEDIKVALEMFDLSSYIYTFDLKSAYHHIDVFPDHRTYLGFAWKDNDTVKYYVYNSLAFGLATAGHIFTKVLRAVIKYCRNKGHKVIMFLDDGIGGHVQYENAYESSNYVKKLLVDLGFLLANDKCNWTPLKIGVGLSESIKRRIHEAGILNDDDDVVAKRMATHLLASRADGTVNKYLLESLHLNDVTKRLRHIKTEDKVAIPVLDENTSEQLQDMLAEKFGASLSSIKYEVQRMPMQLAKRLCIKSPETKLRGAIRVFLEKEGYSMTENLMKEVPSHWEIHGDLVLVPCTAFTSPIWHTQGPSLWREVANSLSCTRIAQKRVVSKDGFRTPQVTLLLGDSGWVEQLDNGIRYTYDITKCMFSSGNITEKLRVARFDCTDEVVIDLYAGIGYFTLPYLVYTGVKHLHACEWNLDAVEALRKNLVLNNVQHKCTIHAGDNRKTCPQGIADRVNLGLIPSSRPGWEPACAALRTDIGGTLHIHYNVNTKPTQGNQLSSDPTEVFRQEAKACSYLINGASSDGFISSNKSLCLNDSKLLLHESNDHKSTSNNLSDVKVENSRICVNDTCQTNHSYDLQVEQFTSNSNNEGNTIKYQHEPNIRERQLDQLKNSFEKSKWLPWSKDVAMEIKTILESIHGNTWSTHIVHIEHVKSYAPFIDHVVLDLHCKPNL